MGFNIAGMVFDTSYENNIAGLERQFGFKLGAKKPTTLEDVSKNWWDGTNSVGVVFIPTGTLIFCDPDTVVDHAASPDGVSLSFTIVDTSGAYAFAYSKNGTILRDVMAVEDALLTDEGAPQPFEIYGETSQNVWAGIDAVLGQPFSSLLLEQHAYIFEVERETPVATLQSVMAKPEQSAETKTAKPIPQSSPEKRPSILGRIFGWLFNRNKATPEYHSPIKYPTRGDNFLDQILALCQKEENVERAYLAQQYNHQSKQHEFILGIQFNDKKEALVKSAARFFKNTFLNDRELYFVSNITDPDLFSDIEGKGYPFYVRRDYFGFRERLTQWALNRELHAKSMEMAIRSSLITLIATADSGNPDDRKVLLKKGGEVFTVVTDETDRESFVPIFTDVVAATGSAYFKETKDAVLIDISIPDFNQLTDSLYKGKNFILNPTGTSMEFFFKL